MLLWAVCSAKNLGGKATDLPIIAGLWERLLQLQLSKINFFWHLEGHGPSAP